MSRLKQMPKNVTILSNNKRTNVDYVRSLSSLAVVIYQFLINVKIFSENVQVGIKKNSFKETTLKTTIIIFIHNVPIIVYLY